ncbi:DUF5686 family protein [Prevotella sp. 10(H)]|uniref:DUF5686 family protein n=1 Tax=Prevotella sp. 10(H) TaxID=1158294 RepID=UPI000A951A2F|nr:DUF5686 family protein [Prevotella sp. 10(H)]
MVRDTSGVPLEGVSVFIGEASQGLVTNKEGLFQTTLPEGRYTLLFDQLDYKLYESKVILYKDSLITESISLQTDSLHIDHTQNSHQRNAMARGIMREVIRTAPRYAETITGYQSFLYTKGNFSMNKISDIIDWVTFKVEKYKLSDIRNKTFRQEIYSEMDYSYPDDYHFTIKAYSGNIPDEINYRGLIDILGGSIYSSRFNIFISPLNSSAFSYYRYRYRGYYKRNGKILHKIEVEPRLRDPELISGYLLIADGEWYVDKAIITDGAHGVNRTTTVSYQPLKDDAYLPVSYSTDINFDQLGVSGTVSYYTSVKYNDLSGKAREIVPEMAEITPQRLVVSSDAKKKDALYWDSIRTVPLHSLTNDSLYIDSIPFNKEKYNPANYWIGRILFGDYLYGNNATDWSVRFSGVKYVFWDYNYVDGFWVGQKFNIKGKLEDNKSIEISPYVYYLTARHRALYGGDVLYNYSPKRQGQLTFSAGSRSADFNSLTVTRYQNYFASLFMGENYNFLFQKDYANVSNSIYVTDKIKTTASLGIEKRHGLRNHTDFNLLNRHHIKDNIFPDDRFDRTYYSLSLSYTPFTRYSPSDGVEMLEKKVPMIFNVEYQEGFSSWQVNNSKYRKLKGGFIHNIDLDYFNRIDYKIEGGVFLRKDKNMHFADYQHFGASDLLINLNSLFDSFLLLGNYELQTNRYWVNIFLNYSGKYVLLKYIPFLQGKPFTENIHIKTLFTPDVDSYAELGYSVSITRRIGIGTYVSLNNVKFKKFGVRFSLNLSSLGIK